MSEYRSVLERVGDRVAMPEPALDRLATHRRRKDRNRRIGTAALALIVAAAAIGSAVAVFRAGTKLTPAGTNETSTITPENVGDLGLAWTASTAPGLLPPVVRDGSVFVSSDRLYEFPEDCRTDGGTCEPSWSASTPGPLTLDGDTLYAGSEVYDLTCEPGPCLVGDLPFPKDVRLGPVVDGIAYAYAVGDREIVAGSCERDQGTAQGTCRLLWAARIGPPEPANWDFHNPSGLTVADGKVFVTASLATRKIGRAYEGLYAFDARCRDDGGTCDPSWVVHGDFGEFNANTPVGADGVVFVTEGRFLDAFAEDCGIGGATCEPLWVGPIGPPIGYTDTGAQNPVAADGVVYVPNEAGALSAFSTTCTPRALPAAGIERFCDPLWAADLGPPILADGKLLAIDDNSHHLFVYSSDCGQGGAVCEPLWTPAVGKRSMPAEVADGVVYLQANAIAAYDLNCRADGGECKPLWTQKFQGPIRTTGLVVADGGVYVGCCNGTLYVFRVGAGKRGLGWLVPVAGVALALAVGLAVLVVRRRGRNLAVVR